MGQGGISSHQRQILNTITGGGDGGSASRCHWRQNHVNAHNRERSDIEGFLSFKRTGTDDLRNEHLLIGHLFPVPRHLGSGRTVFCPVYPSGVFPMNTQSSHDHQEELREANSCLTLGAGLGVVSTTTAFLAGATCPLCVVLAPALIGVGAWKRYRIRRDSAKHPSAESQTAGPV